MANTLESGLGYAEDVRDGRIEVGHFIKLAIARHFEDLKVKDGVTTRFNKDLAAHALNFFNFVSLSKGESDGGVFICSPWQAFTVISLFGWQVWDTERLRWKRRFRTAYIEIPKKNGKALALDTPIPTPSGWSTMGSLSVGDKVFDENGKPCNVTFVTPTMYNHKCYEVVFSDGAKVIADEEHLWETIPYVNGRGSAKFYTGLPRKDWHNKRKEEVFTTKQIKDTLHFKMAGVDVCNHRIRTCEAVEYDASDLPIEPYLLGFWLGDGHSSSATVTIGDQDKDLIKELEKFTIVREHKGARQENAGGYLLGNGLRDQASRNASIQARLRKLNLINNKHIPDIYLTADVFSRSEGHV